MAEAKPKRRKPAAKPRRALNDPKHTACHEAGHAVIARVLTLACGGASIAMDHDSAGHAIIHNPYLTLYQWEQRGKFRVADNAVWYGYIIARMAGAEAEACLLGKCLGGDGDDRLVIEQLLDEITGCPDVQLPSGVWTYSNEKRRSAILRRLRKMTGALVRRHRARIEAVAKALLAKQTLSQKRLDALTGL
ncbi:hypothetical protein [Bradyrhizobium sp. Ash2021]|uniref:hypothetical protein n=1 Tax=Bradyrhizobium sp. Ash2021 TaxID=2954771 RepID=UPI002815C349|nr:hypothetical protein [Bradyrhizobium sp. Ash2021]WMT76053.1 hypothetical protein NL528_06615 [Bradyrhizobium sp. Ash2021]